MKETSEVYKLYALCQKRLQDNPDDKIDDQTLAAYMAYKGVDRFFDPESSAYRSMRYWNQSLTFSCLGKPQDNGEAMLQYVTGCLAVGEDELLKLSHATEEDLTGLVEIAGRFGQQNIDKLYPA